MKKILIFGSCVSRDPFGHPIDPRLGVELLDYYARSSLSSLSSPRSTCDLDLSKIPSQFQRKMVERDFRKDFLGMNFSKADAIILDFVDDRFQALELENGSIITNSDEFKIAQLNLNYRIIQPFSDEFFELWIRGWNLLINNIKINSNTKNLLINRVYLALIDDEGSEFQQMEYIKKMNAWLSRVYRFIEDNEPDCRFINYQKNQLVAKSKHKWGRSPFHFTEEINNAFISQVIL